MWRNIVLVFVLRSMVFIKCEFTECHDDPAFSPEEGPLVDFQFTWLGVLQYIHVKKGNPHYFRVPRVVLISRQFALCTAIDAAHVPEGYALGNVVFGDYERDEDECHITVDDVASGIVCDPAILLMPIADVLLHPEYKHFGAKNSVALLKLIKPIKSTYMLPACLPNMNYLVDKEGQITSTTLFHVDFTTDVPRDFITEEKEVKQVSILPRELCYLYDSEEPKNSTKTIPHRMACTTGCGFHSGAATIIHEHTGHWSIVALSQGNHLCPDPLRPRRRSSPPRHIIIHPYVPWITAAITGKTVRAIAKDDPFGYMGLQESKPDDSAKPIGWVGHWWLGGLRCYDRGEAAENIYKFYHEIFQLNPAEKLNFNYYLEIHAPLQTSVVCVKVYMPFRLGQPRVWDLGTNTVKMRIPLLSVVHIFKFRVEAWGYDPAESSQSERKVKPDLRSPGACR